MLMKVLLDKAPMIFLVVAAVMFVIGLNIFVYTPSQTQVRGALWRGIFLLYTCFQVRYVSLSTNVITGMHAVCLLAVALWFIYQLKHDTAWAKWFRTEILESERPGSLHLRRNIYWYVFYTDDLCERRSIAIGHSDSIRACSG